MKFALKGQATAGQITKFDCTGGEPNDTHRTVFELDPCPDDVMKTLETPLAEVLASHGIDLNAKLGDFLNYVLANVIPEADIPVFGQARLQLRKMDSDGRA